MYVHCCKRKSFTYKQSLSKDRLHQFVQCYIAYLAYYLCLYSMKSTGNRPFVSKNTIAINFFFDWWTFNQKSRVLSRYGIEHGLQGNIIHPDLITYFRNFSQTPQTIPTANQNAHRHEFQSITLGDESWSFVLGTQKSYYTFAPWCLPTVLWWQPSLLYHIHACNSGCYKKYCLHPL